MATPMGALIAAVMAAGLGCGVMLLVWALQPRPQTAPVAPGRLPRALARLHDPKVGTRLGLAAIAFVLVLVVTRWPVAALGGAALVVAWPHLFGGARIERTQIVTLEALVIWTESLRDTVAARASLEQAIPVTATHAPPAIRPALARLVGRLRARVPLDAALMELAAELRDPSADKVLGALILNARQRGSGLATVLTALAVSGRAELDQRRRVNAGRSSMRRSVQLVVVITVAFAVFLSAFSRTYVEPYGTVGGQVALAVVVGLFAASFLWLRRLGGGDPAPSFLTGSDPTESPAELKIVHHLTGVGDRGRHGNGSTARSGAS
jgi:Flp pilus assembly protein TadB